MANVISPAGYTQLSDYYADLVNQLGQGKHYLYDAVYAIVLLESVDPVLDLLQPFYNVYVQQQSSIGSDAPFLPVVTALNNHVIRRSGSADLNTYLFNNSIQIDPTWATMCADAGYTVASQYIL